MMRTMMLQDHIEEAAAALARMSGNVEIGWKLFNLKCVREWAEAQDLPDDISRDEFYARFGTIPTLH